MFLILGGPLGIFLVLIWVLLEEKSERDRERWERKNPVFRKLPSHIPPANNPMHEWEAEMIRSHKK